MIEEVETPAIETLRDTLIKFIECFDEKQLLDLTIMAGAINVGAKICIAQVGKEEAND